jgi:uncharacterized protein
VAYELPAWSYKIRTQLQSASKYYLFDNGVVRELSNKAKPATNRCGKLFESFIVVQILHSIKKNRLNLNAYHYREKSGKEIDLILQKDPHSNPIAIEIKSATHVTIKDVPTLNNFKQALPNSKAIVICRTLKPYTENNIDFLPVTEGFKVLTKSMGS